MNKYVYIIRSNKPLPRQESSRAILEHITPQLVDDVPRLIMNVADPQSDIPSPAPGGKHEPVPIAVASIWYDNDSIHEKITSLLDPVGFFADGYLVEESIYTEYGGNRHHAPRDWEDGTRSPGIVAITVLNRPKRLSHDEWIRRWHGSMSPVSERIQPRCRYVRNIVLKKMNGEAPDMDGIVMEVWPSPEHITNPYLFYGADNVFQLVKNMLTILKTVLSILNLMKIRTWMMGEYFIKTR